MICDFHPDGGRQLYFGLYPAIVTELVHPNSNDYRVQVKFPWLGSDGDRDVRAWATLISPYADQDQGLQMVPEVDSQVVVAFEAGNLNRPYIVGSCWNGQEAMPEAGSSVREPNNKRLLKTRSGSLLEFDDTEGAAKITLSMSSGHKVVLDDVAQQIQIEHSNGSSITINAAGQVQVQANATVEVNASVVNVHAPVANFDGIVKCQTLIASTSVVSPSYTPGAGNVW